jgi:hypothetical protein
MPSPIAVEVVLKNRRELVVDDVVDIGPAVVEHCDRRTNPRPIRSPAPHAPHEGCPPPPPAARPAGWDRADRPRSTRVRPSGPIERRQSPAPRNAVPPRRDRLPEDGPWPRCAAGWSWSPGGALGVPHVPRRDLPGQRREVMHDQLGLGGRHRLGHRVAVEIVDHDRACPEATNQVLLRRAPGHPDHLVAPRRH